jgi:hypothetical protein
MKRQGDRQVQEEDEKARWQTGSGRGWKGKLTDRLGKRMKRQTNRQARGRGWIGKLTDRFRKRMKRQADKQVQEEDEKASWQTGSGRG